MAEMGLLSLPPGWRLVEESGDFNLYRPDGMKFEGVYEEDAIFRGMYLGGLPYVLNVFHEGKLLGYCFPQQRKDSTEFEVRVMSEKQTEDEFLCDYDEYSYGVEDYISRVFEHVTGSYPGDATYDEELTFTFTERPGSSLDDEFPLPPGWSIVREASEKCGDGCCDYFALHGPDGKVGNEQHSEAEAVFRGMVGGYLPLVISVTFEGKPMGYYRPKDIEVTVREGRKNVKRTETAIVFRRDGSAKEEVLCKYSPFNRGLDTYARDMVIAINGTGIFNPSFVEYEFAEKPPVSRFDREDAI